MIKSLLFFLFFSSLFASEKGYELIEDRAALPLLNFSLSEKRVAKLRLDNGLEAYLVSDPGTEEAAASLSVEAGSWDDPQEYPGMAHFLEHMLFMGTHAFPDEREYWQYIQDHGGSANAFTAPDRTVYLFSIKPYAFEGAVERFSHFFIDPLFSPACIHRELHAVDQEHAKNIENDLWREWMIFKECGNPDHPNAKFSTGNAKTLSGIPQEALKKWYQSHYSARVMHLILLSPQPLEQLISLTSRLFSKIPSFPLEKNRIDLPLASSKQRGHFTYISPIKDLRRLTLTWEIPSSFVLDEESHAPSLISYALSHGGERGLLQKLKEENLVEDLAIEQNRLGKKEMLFSLILELTHQGLSQIDTVIARCFQAIARLKCSGISPNLFQEMQKISTLNYQYQSRENAFAFVNRHGFSIVDESLSTYPEKSTIPSSYNPAALSLFIEQLTPQNCLFTLHADPSLTGQPTTAKEKWMEAEYALGEISKTKLLSWQEIHPHPHIRLPDANPYLPENLALKTPLPNAPSHSAPHLLYAGKDGKIYYAQDTKYLVPECGIFFNLKSSQIDGSPQRQMLLDLFILALQDQNSQQNFFLKKAGYSLLLFSDQMALKVELSGYSDKAPLILKELFKKMKSLSISSPQFIRYKEELATCYENQSRNLPLMQALDFASGLLTNFHPTSAEKLVALRALTFEESLPIFKELFDTVYAEGMIFGNLTETEALQLSTTLKALFDAKPYLLADQKKREVLLLPKEEGPLLIEQKTERQGSGVLLIIDCGPFALENHAAESLLASLLQEAFFDTLRTKQQTAYIAKAFKKEIEHHIFQCFAVQSSTHTPTELLFRFELFLEEFLRNFEANLAPERFRALKEALAASLEMAPENLSSMTTLLHTLAFEHEGDFSFRKKRLEGLKELSYEELQSFARKHLSRHNGGRLAVLMEGAPAKETLFHYRSLTKKELNEKRTYTAGKEKNSG